MDEFLLMACSNGKVRLFQDVVTAVDDAFTLFYGKFRTNAPRVKSLMEQIEQRVDKSPE